MKHATDAMTVRALDSMRNIGSTVHFSMNEAVYAPRQPATHWYRVIEGTVRELSTLATGKRDIVDFLLPGDVFGLTAGENYEFLAEAVSTVTLERFPRAESERLAHSDAIIAYGLSHLGQTSRDRRRARNALLAHSSAQAKVGGFLLQMLARTSLEPDGPIDLAMSRNDIADHLGLSMETVCRALTSLRTQKFIALEGTRRMRIIDPMRLARIAHIDSALVPAGQPDRVRNVCLTLATQLHR